MITEEDLAQQFNVIIEHTHPSLWQLLRHCYVKVINPHFYLRGACIKANISYAQYIGIYCPDRIISDVIAQKNLLREVAEYLGLVEVVCLNANNLVRDRLSNLKDIYPHLWLDLLWIVTQEPEN
ncbi:hypothetical protein I8751_04700 [Nostocaceae cyanobacterium CENA357]|uniref:Uncharacterized protein n=1 Tax=Atlanticothrix silvestris CENA357 TaxID=1725252 RepID=A0A8J7HER9_9CYAN|nr:hypothetical protein [Atlanticothrix silvestris]MBH8551685.1 hypothetical protein [Atlanticothrix silvestris CENA357]